jgi:hypothetical protein
MYRLRPDMYARPIAEYPENLNRPKAIMLMIQKTI